MGNLIFDYTAPNTINQVTIDLSSTPLQKGELYKLTASTIGVLQTNFVLLYVNGNNTATNYWTQLFQINGTLNQSDRRNFSGYGYTLSGIADNVIAYIKVTNSGHVVFITQSVNSSNSTPTIQQNVITSTFTVSSITSLQIATQTGGLGWGTGSRFQLYKVGEKVAEVNVLTTTTSITFDNLTIGKDNEYLLEIDGIAASQGYSLYVNNNQTATNYWRQLSQQFDTSIGNNRVNSAEVSTIVDKTYSITNIKLTNNGYFTFQNTSARSYGGSGIMIDKRYGTSTFTTTEITRLDIVAGTNGIGAGSRIELYKLI